MQIQVPVEEDKKEEKKDTKKTEKKEGEKMETEEGVENGVSFYNGHYFLGQHFQNFRHLLLLLII